MRKSSLWIIRAALTVQLIGVLAVPVAVAASESPRGTWIAEWLRPRRKGLSPEAREREGRTFGILTLRDGKLSFVEQAGDARWQVDLASVTCVSAVNRALIVESVGGAYVVATMESDLAPASTNIVVEVIDRAMQAGR